MDGNLLISSGNKKKIILTKKSVPKAALPWYIFPVSGMKSFGVTHMDQYVVDFWEDGGGGGVG